MIREAELIDILRLLKKIKKQLLKRDQTIEGFNIGINSGSSAGQTIMHCHIHLIPRRKNDVKDPRGGIRNIIKSKNNSRYLKTTKT